MSLLNKKLADLLCTTIAVGFIAGQPQAGTRTAFTYEDKEGESARHAKLANLLKAKTGVDLEFKPLPSGKGMNCVIAKTKAIYSPELMQGIADDLRKVVDCIEGAMRGEKAAPYGAYIGAKASISSAHLVGPSGLELYEPKYRDDIGEEVGNSYEKAREASNLSIRYIRKKFGTEVNSKITFVPEYVIEEIKTTYTGKRLFKSCHGMIQAMQVFTPLANGECYLEIALGDNTTKVASCIPCSIFMSANGYPASATHLGRGDNWNIQQRNHDTSRKWAKQIKAHYDLGKNKMDSFLKANPDKLTGLKSLENHVDVLHDIFLEALTYESSFIDKMTSVFEAR